jgi:hypothetical protein
LIELKLQSEQQPVEEDYECDQRYKDECQGDYGKSLLLIITSSGQPLKVLLSTLLQLSGSRTPLGHRIYISPAFKAISLFLRDVLETRSSQPEMLKSSAVRQMEAQA